MSFSFCLFSSLILIRLWRLDLQVNKYVRFDSPRVSNPRCIADCQNLLTYPPAMFCFCVSQRIFKLRCCFCIFVIKLLVLFVNAVCDFFCDWHLHLGFCKLRLTLSGLRVWCKPPDMAWTLKICEVPASSPVRSPEVLAKHPIPGRQTLTPIHTLLTVTLTH